MTMESEKATEPKGAGTTRRTALKLGAGAGVGLAAWSGMSITSLGGTPAYAVGCTFVVVLDLSGGCRNTDQASGADFGYHTLKTTGFPSGYAIVNNVPEGTACNAGFVSTLTFPAGITCAVTIQFNAPDNCTGTARGTLSYGPSSTGSLDIALACVTPAFAQSTQYKIVARCNTTGAPASCLN